MPKSSHRHTDEETCAHYDAALVRAFAVLGKRWSGLVLHSLRAGPTGYRDLSRLVGTVSDSVLSDRLSDLTEAGLVDRAVCAGPPVTVSYQLTAGGQALLPALDEITRWSQTHLATEPD